MQYEVYWRNRINNMIGRSQDFYSLSWVKQSNMNQNHMFILQYHQPKNQRPGMEDGLKDILKTAPSWTMV